MASTAETENKGAEREETANSIVRRNVLWASGVGLITVPIIDVVGVGAIQLKMISELSAEYDVPFMENAGKSAIAALISGLGHRALALGAFSSTIKMIPGLGSVFGAFSVPLFAGALTYAVGKVFTMHFESGGTFLDFDARAFREKFQEAFEEGKPVVKQAMDEEAAST